MRIVGAILVLACVLYYVPAIGEEERRYFLAEQRARQNYVLRTRPHRLDEPLREENISDDEVREIEVVTETVYPGSIANIAGVTEGCPCEDGPSCGSQVWILAYQQGKYLGLMLSRIDEVWMVGPTQAWWFRYDRFRERYRESWTDRKPGFVSTYYQYLEERQRQIDSFPYCVETGDHEIVTPSES